jgi:exopolysaccharide biosynthesis polyprenyl glycosylphosphotransferase
MAFSASVTTRSPVFAWREMPPLFARRRRAGLGRARSRRSYRRAHGLTIDPSRSQAKRVLDLVGAGLAMLCLAPLFAVIAIAIKASSPGPALFTQNRYGYRNHRFRIYKFRTMHTHLSDIAGVRQTVDGDPRVTRIGRFLRNTSLDELPQLINVLKGDMSLVGPRPHVPRMRAADALYEDVVPYYFQRHTVKPGITGLAQVNGFRGSTENAGAAISRIHYDLEYIETWSVWLDVRIIVRTAVREFLFGSGT